MQSREEVAVELGSEKLLERGEESPATASQREKSVSDKQIAPKILNTQNSRSFLNLNITREQDARNERETFQEQLFKKRTDHSHENPAEPQSNILFKYSSFSDCQNDSQMQSQKLSNYNYVQNLIPTSENKTFLEPASNKITFSEEIGSEKIKIEDLEESFSPIAPDSRKLLHNNMEVSND